jgi:1-deoxy-D-xylulose-5-phosphate reductoisomerase
VVIHPESVIHSLVEFVDGSAKAQLGNPDMRLPIGLGLAYPERLPGVVPPTPFGDLGALRLHRLDGERFPAVRLARQSVERGGSYPAVLNAANEEAVAAFLDGRLPFTGILAAVEAALSHHGGGDASLDEILAADALARRHVKEWLGAGRTIPS